MFTVSESQACESGAKSSCFCCLTAALVGHADWAGPKDLEGRPPEPEPEPGTREQEMEGTAEDPDPRADPEGPRHTRLSSVSLSLSAGVKLDPSKAWCPVLECQAVCSLRPSTEGRPGAVPCATCRAVFCSACRGAWRDGHACSEQQPMMSPSASHGWVRRSRRVRL